MGAWRRQNGGFRSVVQLVLQPSQIGQLLQLLELPVSLVADEGAIEVHREDDEDQSEGHHDGGGGDGGGHPGRLGVVAGLGLDWQELDPAQQHHLGQEEQRADDGGERPRQLDVAVHALMGGLLHRVEVVDVAHCLDVGQNAGADHQSKQVNGHQDRGAGAEGDEQSRRVRIGVVQLHLHHRHLTEEAKGTLDNHHEARGSEMDGSRYHGKAGKQG